MARRYSNLRVFGGVSGSSIAVSNEFILPTSDGSTNQVMQTDGSGNVSWATVSGGTGSTSPAGSDTFIQFNDGGSFGANSGLTYDNTFNNFFTESKIGTKTTTLTNGITNLFGQPLSGASGIGYNNSLSGASAFTGVFIGDFTDIGGDDYSTLIGYYDNSTFEFSFANFTTEGIQLLNRDTLAYEADLIISPQNNVVRLRYDDNILNTTGELEITDSNTTIKFDDGNSGTTSSAQFDSTQTQISFDNSGTTSFLSLNPDGINLRHGTGGFSTTGIFIDDNGQISVNLDNTGITQSFIVIRQSSPSVYDNKFEVDTDGYVTINNLYTLPNVDGSEGQTLQTDGAGTVSWANPYIGGMFAQTGDSATVSATTTETSIVGDGVGSLSVPADSFRIGDSFHAKIGGYISSQNNAELTIRIKDDGSTLTTLGPIVLPTMSNQFWELEVDFTMRVTGATGSIKTNGQFVYVQNSGNNYNGYGFNTDSSIDTTVLNELGITVEWGTTDVSNAIMSDLFYLKKCY